MTEKSKYELLAAIDVSKFIEKKGALSYLSWAWACDQMLRADPLANWAYKDPVIMADGSMLVICSVTAFGKSMTMHLPVMDYKNKAIFNPNAFDVNTAMMRCLVKAIALHGLGLYIYAGEDLPIHEQETLTEKQVAEIETLASELDADIQKIVAFYKVKSLKEIPESEHHKILRSLEKRRDGTQKAQHD